MILTIGRSQCSLWVHWLRGYRISGSKRNHPPCPNGRALSPAQIPRRKQRKSFVRRKISACGQSACRRDYQACNPLELAARSVALLCDSRLLKLRVLTRNILWRSEFLDEPPIDLVIGERHTL